MSEPVPKTVGICPVCWPEFSVPDPLPGDTCPAGPHRHFDEDDERYNPPLVIYVPQT